MFVNPILYIIPIVGYLAMGFLAYFIIKTAVLSALRTARNEFDTVSLDELFDTSVPPPPGARADK